MKLIKYQKTMQRNSESKNSAKIHTYTKEDLVVQVKMLAKELGRTPKMDEFIRDPRVASTTIIYKFFGSWNELLETADLKINQRKNYTKEELISQVNILAEELGRTPTMSEFNQDSRTASVPTAANSFGSWNKFLETAGLKINRKKNYTKQELIAQIKMLAKKLGKTPTAGEFALNPEVASATTVIRLFGSWNNFLESAELKCIPRKIYTKETLIHQIKLLATELEKTPTADEFDQDSKTASTATVIKTFGSWNNFLEAARLKLNQRKLMPKKAELNKPGC